MQEEDAWDPLGVLVHLVVVDDSVHARRILARADLDYGTAIMAQCSRAIFHNARAREERRFPTLCTYVGSVRGRARLGAH